MRLHRHPVTASRPWGSGSRVALTNTYTARQATRKGAAAAGQCPFLQAHQQLATPPLVQLSWLKRVQLEILDMPQFQRFVLGQAGSAGMARLPQQPGFPGAYMPGTAQLVREVLAEEAAGRVTQGLAEEGYKAFATLLGEDNVLVVKSPQRHARLRGLLQPAFAGDAVAAYLPAVQALVGRHLAEWEAAGPAGIKAYPRIKMLTFDFILQVVMGSSIPTPELQRLSELFTALTSGLVAFPYLDIPFTPFSRALKAKKQLWSSFQDAVTSARQQLAAGQEVPGVLGRLVAAEDEEGSRLADDEVVSNLMVILFAGHDTSSTTLTRALSNQTGATWDKLRAEQRAVLAGHGEAVTAAALRDMPYAEAVIRETLRCHPTVSMVMRVASEDLALGGYRVPASTLMYLPTSHLGETDPRWAGETGALDPAAFNPDRFLTPEGAKPGQQMPFGAGARYCLGAGLAMAEMKLFLALLARSYTFVVDNNTAWKPALGYYPANGLPLVLTRAPV